MVFRVWEYSHWIRLGILSIFPLQMPRELLRRSSLGLQLYLKHLLKVSQRLCRSRRGFFFLQKVTLPSEKSAWGPRELRSHAYSDKICVFGTRRGSPGRRGSGVKNCGSDPHPTRAGGQDDGSYTNSLKSTGMSAVVHFYFIISYIFQTYVKVHNL